MNEVSRRRLFTVLAGSGLALGITGRASAFEEIAATPRLQGLRDNACGASSSHQQLVDDVNRILGETYTPEQKQAVVAGLSCPVCGCPLAGLF
jgi:hypothetical protein